MQKLLYCVLAVTAAVSLGACGEDSPSQPEPGEPEIPETPDVPEQPETPDEPELPAYFYAAALEITTDGGAAVTSKEDYVGCTVSLKHSDADYCFSEVAAGIRGRGNSTWLWYDKKPYRIKFEKKQSLLGLPKAKSWVLLAEYRDPTDLMNAFTFEYAQLLGLPFTNHNRWAEVTLNGKYLGLYHITEQVQQGGEGRVEVDEQNGYLIQLDRDDGPELAPSATDNFWSEVYRMPVCVKNPDDISAEGLAAVRADLASLEKAIAAGDYDAICSQLDIRTMIDFIMLQELVYNVELDAPRSMYMHRDVGSKWAMGPVWDFDAGFDFDWGDMYTGHHFFARYDELVLGTNPATHAGTIYNVPGFFSDLFKIPQFKEAYKARWTETRSFIGQAWVTTMDYYLANKTAWERESVLWPIGCDYGEQIGLLKKWLTNRANYLDIVIKNY